MTAWRSVPGWGDASLSTFPAQGARLGDLRNHVQTKESERMSAAADLGRLACGAPPPGCTLTEILDHLKTTLSAICTHVESFQKEAAETQGAAEPTRFALVGPYLGRSLLEVALTAILGRLDPFRVLILREMQMRPDYAAEKRSLVSIHWFGDIHADKKVDDLWRTDRQVKDMTRALLGDYYEQLFWRRAFQSLMDGVSEERGGEWMRDLRRIPPDAFIPRARQKTASVYSSCSKGVHHEFVIPASNYYDTATLSSQLDDAIEIAATLALVANASKDILFQLPLDEAVECFERVQV
jgi:hypothetical protein